MLPFIQQAFGLQKEELLRDQIPDGGFKNPFFNPGCQGWGIISEYFNFRRGMSKSWEEIAFSAELLLPCLPQDNLDTKKRQLSEVNLGKMGPKTIFDCDGQVCRIISVETRCGNAPDFDAKHTYPRNTRAGD